MAAHGRKGDFSRNHNSIKDFSIVHRIDKSSPMLFLATAEGKVIPTVTLSVTRNVGGQEVEYYKIILKDVLIACIGPCAGEQLRVVAGRRDSG